MELVYGNLTVQCNDMLHLLTQKSADYNEFMVQYMYLCIMNEPLLDAITPCRGQRI